VDKGVPNLTLKKR